MSPKSHRDDTGGPRWIPAYTVGCAIGKYWALGTLHFHSREKQTCYFPGVWKKLPHPWWWLTVHTTLRKGQERSSQSLAYWTWMCSGPLVDCLTHYSQEYTHRFVFYSIVISITIVWPLKAIQDGSHVLLICPHHSLNTFLSGVFQARVSPRVAIAKYHKLVVCSLKQQKFSRSTGGLKLRC